MGICMQGIYGLGLRVSKIRGTLLRVCITCITAFLGLYYLNPTTSGSQRTKLKVRNILSLVGAEHEGCSRDL